MFTWQKKAIKTKANKPRDRNETKRNEARQDGNRAAGEGGAILRTNVEIQVKQGSFSFTSLWPKVITQKSV